jgi:hypothetical protein
VDVQVEMSSLIYMPLFNDRLGKFRHAEPYGKIFHKTLIYRISRPIRRTMIFSLEILEKKKMMNAF